MFVGGKQTVQPGSHTQMRGLQPQYKMQFTICRKISTKQVYGRNKEELFLANV